MRQLVLVHGRSPHRKDAAALKAEWLDALHSGLAAAGLTLPIPESEVRFPYYGDALTNGSAGPVSEIIVRESDAQRAAFLRAVLLEVARECGIGDADIAAEAGPGVAEPDRNGPALCSACSTAPLSQAPRRSPCSSTTSTATSPTSASAT